MNIKGAIIGLMIGIFPISPGNGEYEECINNEIKVSQIESCEPTDAVEQGDVYIDGCGWITLEYSAEYRIEEGHLTRENGSLSYKGHRETWYSTHEAVGQATARDIPGKHVAEDGTIRDEDGYICVASSDLPFYTVVMTSVGPGKVYDCGCLHGVIDIYTTW